jgi:hypothetical protein
VHDAPGAGDAPQLSAPPITRANSEAWTPQMVALSLRDIKANHVCKLRGMDATNHNLADGPQCVASILQQQRAQRTSDPLRDAAKRDRCGFRLGAGDCDRRRLRNGCRRQRRGCRRAQRGCSARHRCQSRGRRRHTNLFRCYRHILRRSGLRQLRLERHIRCRKLLHIRGLHRRQ